MLKVSMPMRILAQSEAAMGPSLWFGVDGVSFRLRFRCAIRYSGRSVHREKVSFMPMRNILSTCCLGDRINV